MRGNRAIIPVQGIRSSSFRMRIDLVDFEMKIFSIADLA